MAGSGGARLKLAPTAKSISSPLSPHSLGDCRRLAGVAFPSFINPLQNPALQRRAPRPALCKSIASDHDH